MFSKKLQKVWHFVKMLVPLCPGLGVIGYMPNFGKHHEVSHQG